MTKPIQKISAADFATLYADTETVTVVDVRTSVEINSEHLAGCHNLPLQELDTSSFKACIDTANYDQDRPVYLLCGSGLRAAKAAELLAGDIANPLVIIEGGINALNQTELALKHGAGKVISLERQVRIAAGLFVVTGVVLGSLFNPLFYGLSAFIGAGLIFAGVTDSCGMAMMLARMPWNRV